MRKSLFYLALLLVGCGGDGGGLAVPGTGSPIVQHAPEILNLSLSPSTAFEMQGGGTVTVTVSFDFSDMGRDVSEATVSISGGTELSCPYDAPMAGTTATMLCDFDISTVQAGSYEVETWLTDKVGGTSKHMASVFVVIVQVSGDWTGRLTGLPFVLHDVLWDGEKFIAVGDSGVILTSADGIDWAEQASGTDADLNAVAAEGSDVVVVGYDATVLLSTDHGQTWSIKHEVDRTRLAAVTMSASQIVAGGMNLNTGDPFMIRSLDRGDNWTVVNSLTRTGHFVSDLIYANGLYIAATDVFSWESDARVWVSVDGEVWQNVILWNNGAGIHTILHDGSQFFAGGDYDLVFTSLDGYNWIELPTPVDRVSYLSAAWSGSELVLAGGITWWYWWGGTTPDFERDNGLSSTDGGATWGVFNINGYYASLGMAWGNGRFVSVGETTPISGEGAIYTSP